MPAYEREAFPNVGGGGAGRRRSCILAYGDVVGVTLKVLII